MRKLQARPNKSGSAILWAVMVLAMLSVFVTAALTITFSYHRRSITDIDSRQSYITARSVALSLAKQIENGGFTNMIPSTAGSEITTPVSGLAQGMGECSVRVRRESEDKLSVIALAERNGYSASCEVILSPKLVQIPVFTKGLLCGAQTASLSNVTVNGDVMLCEPCSDAALTVNGNLLSVSDYIGVSSGKVGLDVFARKVNYTSSGYIPRQVVASDETSTAPQTDGTQLTILRTDIFEQARAKLKSDDELYALVSSYRKSSCVELPDKAASPQSDPNAPIEQKLDGAKQYLITENYKVNSFDISGSGDVVIYIDAGVELICEQPATISSAANNVTFVLLSSSSRLRLVSAPNADYTFSVIAAPACGAYFGIEYDPTNYSARSCTVHGSIIAENSSLAGNVTIDSGSSAKYDYVSSGWKIARVQEGSTTT